MARTALTVSTPKGPYDAVSANGLDFSFAAADGVNGNSFVCSGRELILMHNDHAMDAATVTIASAPDPYGGAKDIATYSLSAGESAEFTHQQSAGGYREYKPTFKNSGYITFKCNFPPDDSTQGFATTGM